LRAFRLDPGPLSWLIDLVFDAGPARVEYTMDGAVLRGLGWREIADWVEGSNSHHIGPQWRREIMHLSHAFAVKAQASQRKFDESVPYDPPR
jgi:hypothetical protein